MAAPLEQLFVQIRADAGKLDRDLKGALVKFGGFSTGALAAIGGVATAVGAIGAAAFAAAKEFESAQSIIIGSTGATGDALDDLNEQFEDVFEGVPEGAEVVAKSMSSLSTVTGATGDALEILTKKSLNASRALGEDAAPNSEKLAKALNAFQAEATEGAKQLDFLFDRAQKFDISLGALIGQVSEYGVVLKNAGFTMAESADLFARLEGSGLSVSRVIPGINAAFRRMATAGLEPKQALLDIVQAMREAETSADALTIATKAFGAEGAQRLTTAVRNGTLALEDLGSEFNNATGSIEKSSEAAKTLGDRMRQLGNAVAVALRPLGRVLLAGFNKSLDLMLAAVQQVTPALRAFGEALAFIVGEKSSLDESFAKVREVKLYQQEVARLKEELGPLGEEITRQSDESLPEYVARLREAAGEMGEFRVEVAGATDELEELTKRWREFSVQVEGVGEVTVTGAENLDEFRAAMAKAIQDFPQLNVLVKSASAGMEGLTGSADRGREALDRMAGATGRAKDELNEFAKTKSFDLIAEEAEQVAVNIEILLDRAQHIVPALSDISSEGVPRVNELSQAFSDAVAAVLELSNSVGNLPAKMAALEPGRALIASLKDELRSAAEQGLAVDDALRLMNEDAIVLNLSLEEQAEIYARLKGVQDETTQSTQETGDAMQDVSTAIDDVSKKLADFALGMTKFRDVALEFARTIIRKIVEGAFKALLDAMFLQDEALTKLIQKWKDFINVLGGAGRAGGRAGGEVGGGGAAGAAGGVANVLTGVANLISGIIGNFQLAKIETTLNAIELNTRQTTRALTGASEILAQQEPVAEGQPGIPGGGQIAGLSADFGPRGTTGPVPPRSPFAPLPPPPEPEQPTPKEDAANEAVVETARQGLGVLQVLFEHSDFLQDIRGQLNFVNDSLDEIKGNVGLSTNHLQRIADILQPQSGSFGNDLVVITKLDQIAVGITELTEQILGDPIASLRDVTAGITQLFVFERDVANVLRDRQVRLLTTAVDLLRSINNKAGNGGGFSLEDLRQANFRQELSEGVIP